VHGGYGMAVDPYLFTLAFVGAAVLGAAVLPMLLAGRPLSFPIIYVALGMAIFALPLRLPAADPLAEGDLVERMTEVTVIVSLMGAGLKLDRPVGWRTWRTTRRLLVVAMPLTIGCIALLGWWAVGLAPAAALLLGSALAPTDPVLASDVQVGPPGSEAEDEVRFGLTSEAGLNDGLAFPFTNAAVAMAAASGGIGSWFWGWLADDVVVKLTVGLAIGYLGGRAIGAVLFRLTPTRKIAESTEGFVALGSTLLVYGVTELSHGYGFVAVFVAATVLRNHERDHEYHEVLHASAESIERLVSAALLVLLGGAVVDGALAPLTFAGAAVGLAVVFLVRPLVGWLSLVGVPVRPAERMALAFFGIRGIGSVYYLAYAVNEVGFERAADDLWAITAFVILVSIVVHGVTAAPAMKRLDADRPAGHVAPDGEPLGRTRREAAGGE
jgi:sodium/hydrogen antiporter